MTWTPHPAQVIDGVVGRYLLIPALLLSYGVTRDTSQVGPIMRIAGGALLCVLATYSTWISYELLLSRYYLTP